MDAELKPCPFCGGSADVHEDYGLHPGTSNGFHVACNDCEANVGKGQGTMLGMHWSEFSTEEEAIDAWNERGGGE